MRVHFQRLFQNMLNVLAVVIGIVVADPQERNLLPRERQFPQLAPGLSFAGRLVVLVVLLQRQVLEVQVERTGRRSARKKILQLRNSLRIPVLKH